MKRVIGIGGIFFKAVDPVSLGAWYQKHLGVRVEDWGGATFQASDEANTEPSRQSYVVWSPFAADTAYFAPSDKPYMINFRVADLAALLEQLKLEGVALDDKVEESESGKFAWIMDPEGNRVELWEPPLAG